MKPHIVFLTIKGTGEPAAKLFAKRGDATPIAITWAREYHTLYWWALDTWNNWQAVKKAFP